MHTLSTTVSYFVHDAGALYLQSIAIHNKLVLFVGNEAQSLTQNEEIQIDHRIGGEASKSPPILFHEATAMPPPPQDSPQTELAPRKRRRKRDDPQNCLTNSEVFDSNSIHIRTFNQKTSSALLEWQKSLRAFS